MAVEITTLEQPIDAMYLIHKALRGEADRTVELARSLENGCSLQAFKLAFTAWATALMYHAEKEVGTEMSRFVDESRLASSHDPVERVKWVLLEKEDAEEQHQHYSQPEAGHGLPNQCERPGEQVEVCPPPGG